MQHHLMEAVAMEANHQQTVVNLQTEGTIITLPQLLLQEVIVVATIPTLQVHLHLHPVPPPHQLLLSLTLALQALLLLQHHHLLLHACKFTNIINFITFLAKLSKSAYFKTYFCRVVCDRIINLRSILQY